MKKPRLMQGASALALVGVLAGGAATLAQTSRRPAPAVRRLIQVVPDEDAPPQENRAVRTLVEDLENSTPDEVRSGRIDRFFTDPAVIITDGQMHQIDWARLRHDRDADRVNPDDRDSPNSRDRRDERENPADRDTTHDRLSSNVRIEALQTRQIDTHTLVVMYTAVIPEHNSVFRQPVVATLVRPSSGRGWLIASYTAENAAIPGAAETDAGDEQPVR
jgi:hypothetical protein